VNQDWIAADRAHVWHPYTQMRTAPPPIPVVRAEGVYLHTADGRRIIDAISSWWVNIHGHNHPRLNRALAEQAARLSQVIFAGFTHEPAARLAAALAERAPPGLTRVFYSDDGSTAVEVALKMAWQYWRNRGETGRKLFVALEGGYHGDTFGAMSVSGVEAFRASFTDLLFEVRRIPPRAERLAELLEREGDRVAGVILEPILQGAGGMRIYPAQFLRDARELTRARGIPLIADEVLTGFGRTGRMFACEHGPISPDIMCLSKALAAGYLPLGATLCTDAIYEAFLSEDRTRSLLHGHSYTGNALACAVALESLRVFDDERCLERVASLELLFRERLASLRSDRRVTDARGVGGIAAIEVAAARPHTGYFDEIGPRLQREALSRDVLLRPLGNVVYAMPPYGIAPADLHRVCDVMEALIHVA